MSRPSCLPVAISLAMLALASAGAAQAGGAVALNVLKGPGNLQVSVAGATPSGAMPLGYTAFGRNTSPPLDWTTGPAATRSYVVLLQDPDAPGGEPAAHWSVWNIPADVTSLPRAMRNVESPTTPLGAAQGLNFHGSAGYSGPRPPPGDPPHHYHVQVFALDRRLRVRPGAGAGALVAAMSGHVLGSGEEVLSFAAPAPKTKPTASLP